MQENAIALIISFQMGDSYNSGSQLGAPVAKEPPLLTHRTWNFPCKLVYSQYRELQSFAQFGSDLDANTKATLAQGERIVEVLKQHNSSPVEVIHQVAILYAVTKGFLKEVPVEKISEYEAFLYETLDARYAGLLAAIRTAGKLEKETEQQLASAIAETVSAFLAAL